MSSAANREQRDLNVHREPSLDDKSILVTSEGRNCRKWNNHCDPASVWTWELSVFWPVVTPGVR